MRLTFQAPAKAEPDLSAAPFARPNQEPNDTRGAWLVGIDQQAKSPWRKWSQPGRVRLPLSSCECISIT